ncbi:4-hydroxythreonine-4-phosphate dehydrogenase [Gammaproteobacteria bacterium]
MSGLSIFRVDRLTKRLVITPGEPAGIGSEVCVRLVQQALPAEPVAVADPELLGRCAWSLGLPLRFSPLCQEVSPHRPGHLAVVPVSLLEKEQPGQLSSANAPYVLETLRVAVELCQSKQASGLVTGPVHKGILNTPEQSFTGHTEFLANLTGASHVVMMLVAPKLRVALATTHLPLKEVSAAITGQSLQNTLRVLHSSLIQNFGISKPKILVCGLNPHAGEDGHIGREEIDVIIPTLEQCRSEGMTLIGPIPADTAFTPSRLAKIDAVLTMYHDQGLPVLKHLGFGRAVNVTLGLPNLVRTSVDHGVALDLAGKGLADPSSLFAAFALALELA